MVSFLSVCDVHESVERTKMIHCDNKLKLMIINLMSLMLRTSDSIFKLIDVNANSYNHFNMITINESLTTTTIGHGPYK